MKPALAVLAGVVVLVAAAPAGSESAPVRQATVAVTDNAFSRAGIDRPTVLVRRGGTVR